MKWTKRCYSITPFIWFLLFYARSGALKYLSWYVWMCVIDPDGTPRAMLYSTRMHKVRFRSICGQNGTTTHIPYSVQEDRGFLLVYLWTDPPDSQTFRIFIYVLNKSYIWFRICAATKWWSFDSNRRVPYCSEETIRRIACASRSHRVIIRIFVIFSRKFQRRDSELVEWSRGNSDEIRKNADNMMMDRYRCIVVRVFVLPRIVSIVYSQWLNELD